MITKSKPRYIPSHESCRRVADAIITKSERIPSHIFRAHVPALVSKEGELIYKQYPVTPETCERVSKALRDKSEYIPRHILLAHVPDYVSSDGAILDPKNASEPATSDDDVSFDLDDGYWVGTQGKRITFGKNADGNSEETIIFRSIPTEILPTEDELCAIGDLLAGGMSPETTNHLLKNLADKKAGRTVKPKSKPKPKPYSGKKPFRPEGAPHRKVVEWDVH